MGCNTFSRAIGRSPWISIPRLPPSKRGGSAFSFGSISGSGSTSGSAIGTGATTGGAARTVHIGCDGGGCGRLRMTDDSSLDVSESSVDTLGGVRA